MSTKKKRKKKTALVICKDRKQFWTTQTQFWQWVRDGVVVKTGEQPLTGLFKREHEELLVLLSNTVLIWRTRIICGKRCCRDVSECRATDETDFESRFSRNEDNHCSFHFF